MNPALPFEVTFCMNHVGSFPTLKDAFKYLYQKVKEHKGEISAILLLEGTWIHKITETHPLGFQRCLDAAHDQGWLTPDGKLTY